MTTVIAEVVTTWRQALELRRLRNECRQYMTGSTAEISEAQQREFFSTQIQPGRVHAHLLRRDGSAVAYATLRPDDTGTLWLSCGVAGNARGSGLGTLVVRLATAAGRDQGVPVRLAVWRDNDRARHVYEKAGYQVTGECTKDGRDMDLMACR